MVLLLDSQKHNNDFISATAMTNMLSHVEELKDNLLEKVKESLSRGWHESMKDVLETSVNRFTGRRQRPEKFYRARKLTEIWYFGRLLSFEMIGGGLARIASNYSSM